MKTWAFFLFLILFFLLSFGCDDSSKKSSDLPSDGDSYIETDGDNIEAEEANEDFEEDGDSDFDLDTEVDTTEAEAEEELSIPRQYWSEGGVIRRQDGHILYLRGVNYSGMAKMAEGHIYPVSDSDIQILRNSGINSVRLLTFWDAVMPEESRQIDTAYLGNYADVVRTFDTSGLFVIIDMHQDLWGKPFSSHGAPLWACPEDIAAGYTPRSPWWINYTSEQVKGCFDNFYASEDLQQAFIDSWVAVAEAVCPFDKVMGFDLLNEPFPGSQLGNLDFDNETLLPLYLRAIEAIEAVCPDKLYFMEPSAAVFPAKPFVFPERMLDRLVAAPHFYPSYVHESNETGYVIDSSELETDILAAFGHYLEDGIPVWVGEFGGITTNPNFDVYMGDIHSIFLRHFVSSALWDYYEGDGGFAFINSQRELKPEFIQAYTMPVPSELPSIPKDMEVNWVAGQISFTVTCEPSRHISILIPKESSSCLAAPESALTFADVQNKLLIGSCNESGDVTVSCMR